MVDDEDGIREVLGEILGDEGYRVETVGDAAAARRALRGRAPELVLLDLWLPDADGLEVLAEVRDAHPELPVVVISGHGNVEAAVQAIRLGAYDFLEKPLTLSRVLLSVANALDKQRLARRVEQLADRLGEAEELVGTSASMVALKEQLRRAAASDSRILIIGENGTGKELVGRQLHALSRRAAAPFVEVNCAAIPDELIESELFGHVKGAFTGAAGDRAGRFEQADGGTLFLDEVADMSLKTQAKVLRVLQEQRFERVGGSATLKVDVRVVAATNKDLEHEIARGRFREDLYFRLAVIPLVVPPLRDRGEDVLRLAEHFLEHFARRLGRRRKRLGPRAAARLGAYPWPGNVRELRNFVERMMIMVPGEEITLGDLPETLRGTSSAADEDLLAVDGATLREARTEFERRFVARRLAECGGNVTRAAAELGIERSNLHRKIRALGIEVHRE